MNIFDTIAGFRLALPRCCMITAYPFRVAALSGHAALAFSLELHRSRVEFNCMRFAASSKAARLSIDWRDAAYHLVFPTQQVALAQLYKYHHQSGNVVSGKLV